MSGTWFLRDGKIVLLVSTSNKYSIYELLYWTQSTDSFPIIQGWVEYCGKRGNSEKSTDQSTLYPVFINEAAYYEKGIAMCLTKK
jgi:Succinylglutamate desuccinylase / Aspartoacylase family